MNEEIKPVAEEPQPSGLYDPNTERMQEIYTRYGSKGKTASIYNTHVKLSTIALADYLNGLLKDGMPIENILIKGSKYGKFVIRATREFQPNALLLDTCVRKARKGKYITFSFMQTNFALDLLEVALQKRGGANG
jgi:hypothetical protein